MPRPKLKTVSTIKPKGFAMNPGSKNIDSPGVFSSNNTNTISSLSTSAFGGTDPDPKKKKATTTLKNALASDKDYQIVPGFEERLGGELEGVTLTASAKTNKQKRQEKRAANKKERRNTYSKTGMAIKTLGTFLPGGGGKYERRQLEKTARKGLF